VVPLFRSDQEIHLTLRGEKIPGRIVYEKSKEIAIRVKNHPALRNETIWSILKNETIHGEFRLDFFNCSFDSRLIDLDEDRASAGEDWILNLQIPNRVRRVNRAFQ